MKINPLESNEGRDFEKTGVAISSPAKKSSEDSFDDDEFGSGDCDMTNEDKGTCNKSNFNCKNFKKEIVMDINKTLVAFYLWVHLILIGNFHLCYFYKSFYGIILQK